MRWSPGYSFLDLIEKNSSPPQGQVAPSIPRDLAVLHNDPVLVATKTWDGCLVNNGARNYIKLLLNGKKTVNEDDNTK